MKTKNRKAMVEMIGLLMIIFSITTAGFMLIRYVTTEVGGRSVLYQATYDVHKDHISAEEFYNDLVKKGVNDLIESGYGTTCVDNVCDDFCALDDVDANALEKYIEKGLNENLESIKYKYKTYTLEKIDITNIEENENALSITITTEAPIKFTQPGISHKMTSTSMPKFVQTFETTAVECPRPVEEEEEEENEEAGER